MEKHKQAVEQLKSHQRRTAEGADRAGPAALAQAKAQYDLVKNGPRQEDIDQARARVEQARAALDLAKTQLSYATVYAPLTGVVLSKNIEPGEYVAPGTAVVTVGDLVNVWLRAYIEETDQGRVKYGQRAWVTTDHIPARSTKAAFRSSPPRPSSRRRTCKRKRSASNWSIASRSTSPTPKRTEPRYAGRRDDRTDPREVREVAESPMYVGGANS